ncbi:MAG: MBL fold metallo-hydrolase [Candidatus Limnocylindria bacterium]
MSATGPTVTFVGTGHAFSDGGRAHSCIHVGAPGVSLLLDCGAGAYPALRRVLDPSSIDAVAVSHLHGDHFGGIPFLVLEQHFRHRTRPLTVAGPPGLPARLRLAELAMYPDFFTAPGRPRFEVREVALDETPRDIGGAPVSAHPVQHIPGAEPHGLRVRAAGKVIAYSGDARWSDDLPRLAKGADLFICEASNFERDDPAHVSYRTVMSHHDELDCGRIVLTHVTRDVIAHRSELELEVAIDGLVLEL